MASNYVCQSCLRTLKSPKSSSFPIEATKISRGLRLTYPPSRSLQTSISFNATSKPPQLRQKTAPEVPQPPTQTSTHPTREPASPTGKTEGAGPVPTKASQLASAIRRHASGTTETYVAYGSTESLLNECVAQASYTLPNAADKSATIPKTPVGQDLGTGKGWWFEVLGLQPTFNTWAQITFLHMYILLTRIRTFPPSSSHIWQQHLTDHFFMLAESRMDTLHGISQRAIRTRYLKDLFEQWRGVIAAYDEGLVKGDAVLAAAVWRNVFKGEEEADPVGLAQVVSFLRREVARIGRMAEDEIARGRVGFRDPSEEKSTVLMECRLMKEPFLEGDTK